MAEPVQCPCGHPAGESYRCIAGRVYGPRGDENCGVCEWTGDCTTPDCACNKDN